MKNKVTVLTATLLVVFCACLFAYTLHIRKPWFGVLSIDQGGHQWLAASTLKFAQYWYNEGPLNLRFGLVENPPSAEFPTLLSRSIYASYPPGTILPIYAISKIMGKEPSPAILMGYDLAQHLLITVLLSLFTLFILIKWEIPPLTAFIFSTIPACIYQLMPGTLYWHQNVYWADQAIILPFVMLVISEYLLDHAPQKQRWIIPLQSLIIFSGALTDWFFLFVVFTLVIKRILFPLKKESRIRECLILIAPAIVALILFTLQIVELHLWGDLVKKFLERTGLEGIKTGESLDFSSLFWFKHIPFAYGKPTIFLLAGSVLIGLIGVAQYVYNKFRGVSIPRYLEDPIKLNLLLLLPCFMQVYVLNNHSAAHNFSTLKFAVPLSLFPFALIPASLYLTFVNNRLPPKARRVSRIFAGVIMLILTLTYVLPQHARYKTFFPEPFPFFKTLGDFLVQNTDEKDIVFSTQGSIGVNPPQFLFHSKKRVYQIDNIFQIFYFVKDLPGPYDICILNNGEPQLPPDLQKLTSLAYDVRHDPFGLTLYKIHGK